MHFKDLLVYKKGFDQAMEILEISKSLQKEEIYSLTDQIRRSSRSACSNIAEAYRKRQYPKHFFGKLSDSNGENSETLAWLDFAYSFKYINQKIYQKPVTENEEIGSF